VTVWDGEVGVSFKKGKLLVMRPDRHLIETADHIFQGFLSTQQQCLHLALAENDPKAAKGPKEAGTLICETKDFVEIGIKADVFFRIEDPERVLLVVGKDNIVGLVRETSIATLNAIIRSTSLAEVAQSKEQVAKSARKHDEQMQQIAQAAPGAPSAPLFFDKVHDEFISKLHDTFVEKYGIEITNIRIESFKILNQELSSSISKQALTSAQTGTQLANLAGQTEIATAQQLRDAEVLRIKVDSDANKVKTETDAKNRATLETAKADADSTLIRAKAEAESLTMRANAEAKAILAKGDAEAQRADMLNKTALGGQIALFQLYTNMVQTSMQGVEKVIYLPTESAGNPLNIFAMNQLLPQIGIGQPAQQAGPNTGRK